MRLDKVLTVGEVAALAGWHRRRMLRHLLRLHEETGGQLLINVGSKARPRWTVTLGALQRMAPQWFVDDETVEARLSALEERMAVSERVLDIATTRLAALRSAS